MTSDAPIFGVRRYGGSIARRHESVRNASDLPDRCRDMVRPSSVGTSWGAFSVWGVATDRGKAFSAGGQAIRSRSVGCTAQAAHAPTCVRLDR
jgi:hypothetical protein